MKLKVIANRLPYRLPGTFSQTGWRTFATGENTCFQNLVLGLLQLRVEIVYLGLLGFVSRISDLLENNFFFYNRPMCLNL